MYAKITTTITTMIDLDSLDDDKPNIDHLVDVTTKDPIPEVIVRAAVLGAAKGLVKKLDDGDE